ncbi:MAG TPA: hypothetical protein VGM37_12985 [Armatimonadota bacterium]|jgi:hypothetical protein
MRTLAVVLTVLGLCTFARADIIVPGANGSDGAFNPTASTTIDLSLAPTAAWDSNSPTPGNGVYDPQKWAVVFHYTSVNIPADVVVSFKNHVSQAPVVWLVSGDVLIAGTVDVGNGANRDPGPGGFRATGSGFTSAFGPGGSTGAGGRGAYGTTPSIANSGQAYGNARIIPAIGGSGGDWNGSYNAVGVGGGAIVIVAKGSISIQTPARISAYPYMSYGSGGAIRLVADSVLGGGTLNASAAYGNDGRIRVEANTIDPALRMTPVGSGGRPGAAATLWPPETAPSTRVVSVGGEAMPADPHAQFNAAADVFPDVLAAVMPVVIETKNVPTTATVNLRIVSPGADAQMIKATFTSGDANTALWTA